LKRLEGASRLQKRSTSEIALKRHGNAYRVIYAVQVGVDIWVIDVFQKKSKTGIKTPQIDVARFRERVKRLKEALR